MESLSQYQADCITQIRSLYQVFKEINPNEYEFGMELPKGVLLIRIRFQADFPLNPPKLIVSTKVDHHLVNLFGTINYPEFYNWNVSTNLINVISNIHQEFLNNPPKPATSASLPDFKEYLKHFSQRLENESDIIKFLYTVKEYKEIVDKKIRILRENIELAEDNIEAKKEYNRLFDKDFQVISKIQELQNKFGSLLGEYNQVKNSSSQSFVQNINEVKNDLNKEASDIFKSFTNKQITAEEFIERYQIPVKKIKLLQMISK